RPERREVRARVRLGVPLAPDLLARENLRRIALLLVLRAVGDERRAGHATPSTFRIGGAFASAISSWRISSSMNVRPRPPYSLGHVRPMNPASKSERCHVRRSSYASTRGISELPTCFHSRGMLSLSQARTVWRNACCSGVSEKSIAPPEVGCSDHAERWFILGTLLRGSQGYTRRP